jgi:3-hydroxyacyl-CoA dehydrogenase
MMPVDAVRHVAVVGAGTVGASWAAFFLGRGLFVSVYDPQPARAEYVARYIEKAWPTVQALGAHTDADPDQWTFCATLADAAANAQYVQECAPDNFTLKRQLFAELNTLTQPDTVIASSTSSLILSDLQDGLSTAARFVIAHPFNPPHVIPVVEVVGGRNTTLEVTAWCAAFLERLGKTVLRLRREVPGHLINRLQAALFQEAIWLVREGVADVIDIDRGIAMGPGLRWAIMGPFLTFHLAARDTGIRGYLEQLGPAHMRLWRDLHAVEELGPALVDTITQGVEEEAGGKNIEALTAQRDQILTDLIRYFVLAKGGLPP